MLATGCNSDASGLGNVKSDMSTQEQFDILMQRPAMDQALKRYRNMSQEIRTRLSDQFDLPEWKGSGGGRQSPGCSEFPDVDAWDAYRHFGDNWGSSKPLTNAQWPNAVTVVKQIAHTYGFDKITIEVVKAQFRKIELADRYGATLYFGKETSTLIGITTGCHLYPEAKKRGTPRQTTNY